MTRDRNERVDQWRGVAKDAAPFALPPGTFQEDNGGDRYFRGVWRRRRGMARSGIPKTTSAITSILGFETPGEDFALLYVEGSTARGVTNPTDQDDGTQSSTSLLAGTLSANHRCTMAEFRRTGFLTNGWNSVRKWNGQTSALQLAGIAGPDPTDGVWDAYPSRVGTDETTGLRRYRYRYQDSTTGYVSNPSNEIEATDRTGLENSGGLQFLIGSAGAVTGPHATGLAITSTTITRDSGSWVDDGFAVGDYITLASCEDSANNGTWGPITDVSATVIYIDGRYGTGTGNFPTANADDTTATWQRAAKGRIQPSSDSKVDKIILEATVVSLVPQSAGQVYGPHTTGLAIAATSITRDSGSWTSEGFQEGDFIRLSSSEDVANDALWGPILRVSETVLTFAGGLTANADDTAATWQRWVRVDTGASEFFIAGEALNTASTINSTYTDAELEQRFLPWPDEGHDPPPISKYVVSHRNRLWHFGQVVHSTGTADFTNASLYVGDGTTAPDWNTEVLGSASGQADVQWMIQKDGDTAAYEIDYFDSGNARLVLKKAYAGGTTTNSSYKIFSRTNVFWLSQPGYPESFSPFGFVNGPDGENAGDITAAVGFGSSMLFFSQASMAKFAWDLDPHVDGSLYILSNKAGALSQRVALEVEGTVFTMDRRGWHAWDGVFPKMISRPIDALRDSIDYTKADQFHACYFPSIRAIRWFVNYTSDSSTYPKRYVQFDLDTGAWSTGQHLQDIAESRLINTADGLRVLLGDGQGHSWFADTGLADGCAAAYSHLTVDAGATTTSIPITGVTLPTAGVGLAGCYLTKRSAAGVNENVLITSNTADTITCGAFAQAPAEGAVLWVGIIPSKLKTRAYGSPILSGKKQTPRLAIAFEPCASTRYLQVRVYSDYSGTAKTWTTRRSDRTALLWPGGTTGYPTSDWLVNVGNSGGFASPPIGMEFKRYLEVELEMDEPDADFMLTALELSGAFVEEADK